MSHHIATPASVRQARYVATHPEEFQQLTDGERAQLHFDAWDILKWDQHRRARQPRLVLVHPAYTPGDAA